MNNIRFQSKAIRRSRAANRASKNQFGAALIELAIAAPVMLILFAGMVDLGRLMLSYIAATRAAYEGTRFAANERGIPATPVGTVTCCGPTCPVGAICPATSTVRARIDVMLHEQGLDVNRTWQFMVSEVPVPGFTGTGTPPQIKKIETTVRVRYEPLLPILFGDLDIGSSATGPSLFPDDV